MTWREGPVEDLDSWFDDYTTRRYGRKSPLAAQAWKTLIPGPLNSTLKETFSILMEIPSTNQTDNLGYDVNDVNDAWDLIVEAVEQDPELGLKETFRLKSHSQLLTFQ
jgi:hypothetical protein